MFESIATTAQGFTQMLDQLVIQLMNFSTSPILTTTYFQLPSPARGNIATTCIVHQNINSSKDQRRSAFNENSRQHCRMPLITTQKLATNHRFPMEFIFKIQRHASPSIDSYFVFNPTMQSSTKVNIICKRQYIT